MASEEENRTQPTAHRGWAKIIKAVKGWLQLIALIVLVACSVLTYAIFKSPETDPLRIWYVALMFVFFFGVVVLLVVDRYLQVLRREQKDQALQKKDMAIQNAFESLGKMLLERYGVQAEYAFVKAEISSEGVTRYTRIFKGISVSQDSPIPYLPGSLMIGKLGKFKSLPKLITHKISDSNKAVSLKHLRTTDNLSDFRIEIEGQLHNNDGQLSYEIECHAEKMFATSKEELEEAYKDSEFKHEYLSQELEMVVKRLEIEVVFPEGFQVTAYPGVFLGQTETTHNLELRRLKLETTSHGAKCSIADPLIGFSYLIYWTPPSASA